MHKSDFEKFAVEMAALAETFGNGTPSKERMKVYFNALNDLSIEQIQTAVLNLLNERTITTTFPVPAEIRNAIGARVDDAALLALDKAEKAVDSYSAVVFDDPVIHMVISAMGGWPKFCCPSAYGDNQEWQWKQKEFLSLYKVFARNPRAECPKVLVGISGTSYVNTKGEVVNVLPKYIGDKQKAIEWTSQKIIESGSGMNNIISRVLVR